MTVFTKQTVWTSAPANQQVNDVAWAHREVAQSPELANALKRSSAALGEKLEMFNPISISESAAFGLVR